MANDSKSGNKNTDGQIVDSFAELLKDRGVNDIERVIQNLNMLADAKRREEYTKLYEEFEERVVALGFTSLQEFFIAIETQGIIKPSRAARRPVAIRYVDSSNPENTWTGRGKQPKWLQAHLQAGRTIEEFEIEPSGHD